MCQSHNQCWSVQKESHSLHECPKSSSKQETKNCATSKALAPQRRAGHDLFTSLAHSMCGVTLTTFKNDTCRSATFARIP